MRIMRNGERGFHPEILLTVEPVFKEKSAPTKAGPQARWPPQRAKNGQKKVVPWETTAPDHFDKP
jgi:hypothetical protein